MLCRQCGVIHASPNTLIKQMPREPNKPWAYHMRTGSYCPDTHSECVKWWQTAANNVWMARHNHILERAALICENKGVPITMVQITADAAREEQRKGIAQVDHADA